RDVRASDEEHERDSADEDEQQRPHLPPRFLRRWDDRHAEVGAVPVRMLRVKTGDELVQPRLGPSGPHPRTQARGGEKAVTATIVLVGRPEPKGKEELRM